MSAFIVQALGAGAVLAAAPPRFEDQLRDQAMRQRARVEEGMFRIDQRVVVGVRRAQPALRQQHIGLCGVQRLRGPTGSSRPEGCSCSTTLGRPPRAMTLARMRP